MRLAAQDKLFQINDRGLAENRDPVAAQVLGPRRGQKIEPQFLHLAAHDALTVEQPATLIQPLFCLGIKLGQVGTQNLGVHAQQRRDLLWPKVRS